MTRQTSFVQRLAVLPFEAAMGFLVFWAGAATTFQFSTSNDALTALMPNLLVIVLNVTYMLSGAGMLLGLGLGRRDLEGGGIVILIGALLIRLTAVIAVAGLSLPTVALTMFYVGFSAACISRLLDLMRNDMVVKIRNNGESPFGHDDIDESQLNMRDRDGDGVEDER